MRLDELFDPPPNPHHHRDCRWYPEANNRHLPIMARPVYPKWVCAPDCPTAVLAAKEANDGQG